MENVFDAAVVSCPDYSEENVRAALEEAIGSLGGFWFAEKGRKIVIKTNLVVMKKPEYAAITHPMMLYVLSEMLIERGCEVVIGDSPGGLFTAAYLAAFYRATGLTAVEKTGAKLNYDTRTKRAPMDGKVVKELDYTAYIDEADFIIDFAKLKTHGMLAFTGAAKNLFGVVPGTTKPEYHYRYPKTEDFADMIVDINEFVKPGLCLIDASTCMEGNGPSNGTPRHMGALIASKSSFNADLVGSKLIGLDPKDVPYLLAANKRGLCPASADEINVYGDIEKYVIPDFKKMPEVHIGFNNGFVKKLFERKPSVIADKCRECGECMKVCPGKAIKLSPKPVIDRKKCIRCFCCQEFCPFSAMEAKRTFIAKLINR